MDSEGDIPCSLLDPSMADDMLLAGCIEYVETRSDGTLFSMTEKFFQELRGATFH